jgi:hypothetical protein
VQELVDLFERDRSQSFPSDIAEYMKDWAESVGAGTSASQSAASSDASATGGASAGGGPAARRSFAEAGRRRRSTRKDSNSTALARPSRISRIMKRTDFVGVGKGGLFAIGQAGAASGEAPNDILTAVLRAAYTSQYCPYRLATSAAAAAEDPQSSSERSGLALGLE